MIIRSTLSGRLFFTLFLSLGLIISLASCDDDNESDDDAQVGEQAMEMPEDAKMIFENEYLKVISLSLLANEKMPDLGGDDNYAIYQIMSVDALYAGDTIQSDSIRENMKDYTAPNYATQPGQDTTASERWTAGKMFTPSEFNGNETGMQSEYLVIWKKDNHKSMSDSTVMEDEFMQENDDMADSSIMESDSSMNSRNMQADNANEISNYKNLGSAAGLTLEEVYIPTGDTLKKKESSPRAIYYLTTCTFSYVSSDQSQLNVNNERGKMEWIETTRNYIVNSGDMPVRILVVKPEGAKPSMNQ
jgi:hypothetical protein